MNKKDVMLTAYFIANEELPLTKVKRTLVLEELHNVELGNAYSNNSMYGEFIDYIANDKELFKS